MDSEDENGGHGYVEHASIGSAVVHVFYADDNEGCENNDKQSVADKVGLDQFKRK